MVLQTAAILLGVIMVLGMISPVLADTIFNDLIPSPRQQIESGIHPTDVICKPGKVLAMRDNGKVACLNDITIQKTHWKLVPIVIENNQSDSIIEITKPVSLILNPSSLSGIISQDVTFDYVLDPLDNPDEFAQKMVNYFDDKILETDYRDNSIRYETERGWIEMVTIPVTDTLYGTDFSYTLLGADRISPNQAESVTFDLINELGITLDGTEIISKGTPSSNYSYYISQTKDDLLVSSSKIITDFKPGYTFIKISTWNDNLSEMNLFDEDESIKNGRDYIMKFDELTGSECDIKITENNDTSITLFMFEKRPVYQMYGGTCQTPYMNGHYDGYFVFVDALTGEALFVQMRMAF